MCNLMFMCKTEGLKCSFKLELQKKPSVVYVMHTFSPFQGGIHRDPVKGQNTALFALFPPRTEFC